MIIQTNKLTAITQAQDPVRHSVDVATEGFDQILAAQQSSSIAQSADRSRSSEERRVDREPAERSGRRKERAVAEDASSDLVDDSTRPEVVVADAAAEPQKNGREQASEKKGTETAGNAKQSSGQGTTQGQTETTQSQTTANATTATNTTNAMGAGQGNTMTADALAGQATNEQATQNQLTQAQMLQNQPVKPTVALANQQSLANQTQINTQSQSGAVASEQVPQVLTGQLQTTEIASQTTTPVNKAEGQQIASVTQLVDGDEQATHQNLSDQSHAESNEQGSSKDQQLATLKQLSNEMKVEHVQVKTQFGLDNQAQTNQATPSVQGPMMVDSVLTNIAPTVHVGAIDTGATAGTGNVPLTNAFIEDLPDSQAQQVMGRALNGVRGALTQNGGTVNVRLTPPELGALRIEVRMSGGTVTAQFHASSAAAGNLLSQNMTALRQALEGQGLTVDRLQVHTPLGANASQQTSTQQQNQQQQNSSGQAANDGRSRGSFNSNGGTQGQSQGERGTDEQSQSQPDFYRDLLDVEV